MTLLTSLAEIKNFHPCHSGWRNIYAAQQGRLFGEQFPLADCLDSNSISDVLWLLGKRKVAISICVEFAKQCADSVAHLRGSFRAAAAAAAYAAAAADAAAAAAAAAYAAAAADAAAAAAADAADAYDAYDAAAAAAAADAAYVTQKQLLRSLIENYNSKA